jgi:hypothetical protein
VSLAGPRRHAPGVLGGISDIAVNAALAIIEGAEPRNEVEAALAIQMACTHTAAMAVLARIGGGHGPDRSVAIWRRRHLDWFEPMLRSWRCIVA